MQVTPAIGPAALPIPFAAPFAAPFTDAFTDAHAAQLRAILATEPDAMMTFDEQGIIETFSLAAEGLFAYPAAAVIGQNVTMLVIEADAPTPGAMPPGHDPAEPHHGPGYHQRAIGRRRDGSIFPHEFFLGETSQNGRRIFTGFIRDLTVRDEIEAQLHQLHADLIRVSRVSAVGTMATALTHALNQPLTTVANYVQTCAALIAEGTDGALDAVRGALDQAGREVLRAGAIVNRLRQFAGGGRRDRVLVSPRELALQTCALGAIGRRWRGITCDVAIAPDIGLVLIDRVHIQQVLLDLIGNALAAMGNGGAISIRAHTDQDMIRITVEDTGSGIAAGQEEELFLPFVSDTADETGLGLAICRTVVEAHGGRLWCESAPTRGGLFHFTLPLALPEKG